MEKPFCNDCSLAAHSFYRVTWFHSPLALIYFLLILKLETLRSAWRHGKKAVRGFRLAQALRQSALVMNSRVTTFGDNDELIQAMVRALNSSPNYVFTFGKFEYSCFKSWARPCVVESDVRGLPVKKVSLAAFVYPKQMKNIN
jgi:hypothetical protein